MTKRKRNWTDETSETLPESSSQPLASNEAKDAGVLDVLPGITRKITACGACRKQKVCNFKYARHDWIYSDEALDKM